MHPIRVALDWTANTNHTGFYVAREIGLYTDADLDVALITPNLDGYETTPAKKLELGLADFALAPFESVISLHTKQHNVPVQAIAALLQEDISAVVTLSSSAITRPNELDGRTYASYKARYEDSIIRQMVINDGGTGNVQVVYPEKLGIWNTLLTNAADATWIFDNWEGVEADTSGVQLTKFRLADYQIPYAYSPVIMATREAIEQKRAICETFINATKKGFLYANENPQAAVDILTKYVPERDVRLIDLVKSQAYTASYYGDQTSWGRMDANRIQRFVDWLCTQGLEKAGLDINLLYTNDLIR